MQEALFGKRYDLELGVARAARPCEQEHTRETPVPLFAPR